MKPNPRGRRAEPSSVARVSPDSSPWASAPPAHNGDGVNKHDNKHGNKNSKRDNKHGNRQRPEGEAHNSRTKRHKEPETS